MAEGRGRVLVVDDEPDLRELITLTLSFEPRLEVVGAVGDAEQALVALARAEAHAGIDLVVLDHWLGGPLTGIDVARRVRARWPRLKVVLFTAADGVHVGVGGDAPVNAVVAKPELIRLPHLVLQVIAD